MYSLSVSCTCSGLECLTRVCPTAQHSGHEVSACRGSDGKAESLLGWSGQAWSWRWAPRRHCQSMRVLEHEYKQFTAMYQKVKRWIV